MTWKTAAIGIACIVLVLVAVVGIRRWVNHARIELVPVIVPAALPSSQVLDPSAQAIITRMAADARDAVHRPQRPRLAVLTFDDGPYPVTTPALLAQLRRLRVPAAFFVIGRDSIEQPALAQAMAGGPDDIGNHTLTHPEMATIGSGPQYVEIADGARALHRATGRMPVFFRPPHGNFNAATIDAARGNGETVALWDVDPGDWRHVNSQFIVDNVTMHARAPAVILLHNGSVATIDALPAIVNAYRAAGFEFVTLSDLVRRVPLDEINTPVAVAVSQ
ncbi:MAG TPA: polysaccharide deacetylase family protein [Candidatus Binatus sp.]|nr:polysaccharide deacetylase family protein [Candidatus Binatus sp.]